MKYVGVIKVLIVEDSQLFREAIARGIEEDQRINVVGMAGDPFEARDMILDLEPDVVLLDIELPKMDGITFLKKLMPQYPLPVIVVSGHAHMLLDALEYGALDYVKKPVVGSEQAKRSFFNEIIIKIKIASMANVSAYKTPIPREVTPKNLEKENRIIAVGASTGGTQAFSSILRELPEQMPPIVVVQHMPENFTKMYAMRLNDTCRMKVKEAENGDIVMPGQVYIAPGGLHMKVVKQEKTYRLKCLQEEKVNGHKPSVDVLFHSVAKAAGANAIGVIMTGMGYDGAKGILEMRRQGAYTIGQDEETSIVYGMPKVAYDIGGVIEQLPLGRIAQKLFSLTHNS